MEIKFKELLRQLDKDEHERLEKSILEEGIRDPLVVWKEENVLLDGHNRHGICTKHDIDYEVVEISLEDDSAARQWIVNNQLARRNLTPNELSYFRGLRYEEEKRAHGGEREASGQNDHLKTSEKLAQECGVSERTIRRDAEFMAAVNEVGEKWGGEYKRKILKGEISKKETMEMVRDRDNHKPKNRSQDEGEKYQLPKTHMTKGEFIDLVQRLNDDEFKTVLIRLGDYLELLEMNYQVASTTLTPGG